MLYKINSNEEIKDLFTSIAFQFQVESKVQKLPNNIINELKSVVIS